MHHDANIGIIYKVCSVVPKPEAEEEFLTLELLQSFDERAKAEHWIRQEARGRFDYTILEVWRKQ